ncbi:AraC family L-rhamnose operon transcriptional activator RhaR [Paenibacillus cellulosilyticus]|uniref:AraC family L-rhamnose operon transcriptional activator RhaR n=1 Tax=Paenibacillus cellulosilyticus TaxID=375489 RepID=A0A2V2YQI9_9BACL|nr:AraC family transcriptional regulator [Paenibacillus cellulosilyticus]PWV99392.1 AraC family L-rhamnose operon transcriptional activator RhaR [Paenibacillus cellulosilyticus]QKS45152.1 AraC family transcriptional regulator [Paenibacillus cellulosilyticus]
MTQPNNLFEKEHFLSAHSLMFVNRFTEDFNVPYHAHDFIEYCYVAEGTGFHHVEQETFPIHKGQLYVIPIGVSHVFRPTTPDRSSKPPVVYNCLFDMHLATVLSGLQEQPIQEHLSPLANNTSSYFSVFDRDGTIERIMIQLHTEMKTNAIGSRAMLHALLSQLIITVYRLKYGDNERSSSEDTANFLQVIDYVEQNYDTAVTLAELSRISGWSERHLQRLFTQYTDQTFGSYLQNVRIQRSCEMLRNSSLKVSFIAEQVGYRSIDSFNQAFKKTVGLTPTAFRKST